MSTYESWATILLYSNSASNRHSHVMWQVLMHLYWFLMPCDGSLSLKEGLSVLDSSFNEDISVWGPCDLLIFALYHHSEEFEVGRLTGYMPFICFYPTTCPPSRKVSELEGCMSRQHQIYQMSWKASWKQTVIRSHVDTASHWWWTGMTL